MVARMLPRLLLAVLAGVLLSAGTARAEDNAAAEARAEAVRTRLLKQIDAAREKSQNLQKDEMELSMQILKAQAKANEGLEKPGKAEQELAKGKNDKELNEYRTLYRACAGQLARVEPRYAALEKQAAAAVESAEKTEEEALANQARMLLQSIQMRRRANLVRMAGMFESVADYKKALAIYVGIWQQIPEEERDKKEHEQLKKTMLKLKERLEPKKDDKKRDKDKDKDDDKKKPWDK